MRNEKSDSEIIPSTKEVSYFEDLEKFFGESSGTSLEKLEHFSKYVPRQVLSMFLAKYEIYKKTIDVQGSIVECGVHLGGGLMTFAQLSAIFEPFNYTRKVIGFDTFEGFPNLSKEDAKARSEMAMEGGFAISTKAYEDLNAAIALFDRNRAIGHISKVELVKGDANRTIPQFLKDNPHTVVSLLYLDFDLFEPTKIAIENFLPRIPKGGIIAFDELNLNNWPGETIAVLETIGIRNLRVRRFPFTSCISYAVLE